MSRSKSRKRNLAGGEERHFNQEQKTSLPTTQKMKHVSSDIEELSSNPIRSNSRAIPQKRKASKTSKANIKRKAEQRPESSKKRPLTPSSSNDNKRRRTDVITISSDEDEVASIDELPSLQELLGSDLPSCKSKRVSKTIAPGCVLADSSEQLATPPHSQEEISTKQRSSPGQHSKVSASGRNHVPLSQRNSSWKPVASVTAGHTTTVGQEHTVSKLSNTKVTNDSCTPAPKEPKRKSDNPAQKPSLALKHPSPPAVYKGLPNEGVMCYRNAIVQCLLAIPHFVSILDNFQHSAQCLDGSCLVCRLNELRLRLLAPNMRNYESATEKFTASCFERGWAPGKGQKGRHQDAAEFYQWLLNQILEDVEGNPPSWLQGDKDTMAVAGEELFKFDLAKTDRCSHCDFTSHPMDDVYQITHLVNIRRRLSLQEMFDRSMISQLENYCSVCKTEDSHIQTSVVKGVPQVLAIQTNRWLDGEEGEKNETHVKFNGDEEINLTRHLDKEQRKKLDEVKYRLCGVVLHRGRPSSGHYISLVRDHAGIWREYDDQNVRETDIDEWGKREVRSRFTGALYMFVRTSSGGPHDTVEAESQRTPRKKEPKTESVSSEDGDDDTESTTEELPPAASIPSDTCVKSLEEQLRLRISDLEAELEVMKDDCDYNASRAETCYESARLHDLEHQTWAAMAGKQIAALKTRLRSLRGEPQFTKGHATEVKICEDANFKKATEEVTSLRAEVAAINDQNRRLHIVAARYHIKQQADAKLRAEHDRVIADHQAETSELRQCMKNQEANLKEQEVLLEKETEAQEISEIEKAHMAQLQKSNANFSHRLGDQELDLMRHKALLQEEREVRQRLEAEVQLKSRSKTPPASSNKHNNAAMQERIRRMAEQLIDVEKENLALRSKKCDCQRTRLASTAYGVPITEPPIEGQRDLPRMGVTQNYSGGRAVSAAPGNHPQPASKSNKKKRPKTIRRNEALPNGVFVVGPIPREVSMPR